MRRLCYFFFEGDVLSHPQCSALSAVLMVTAGYTAAQQAECLLEKKKKKKRRDVLDFVSMKAFVPTVAIDLCSAA